MIFFLFLFREYFDPSQPGGNDHCYKLNHTGVSWDVASDQCEQGLLYFESTDELAFLKERILDPQAERSVVWLAGRKYMNGELLGINHRYNKQGY